MSDAQSGIYEVQKVHNLEDHLAHTSQYKQPPVTESATFMFTGLLTPVCTKHQALSINVTPLPPRKNFSTVYGPKTVDFL